MNNLLTQAEISIKNLLNSGDEFTVEELFTGVIWKNILWITAKVNP